MQYSKTMADNSYYHYNNQLQPPLPPGWSVTHDPGSGRPYYFNQATGETSWHPPALPATVPPPPPFSNVASEQTQRLPQRQDPRRPPAAAPYQQQEHPQQPYQQQQVPSAAWANRSSQSSSFTVSDATPATIVNAAPAPHEPRVPAAAVPAPTVSQPRTLVGRARALLEVQREMVTVGDDDSATADPDQQPAIIDYELSSFSAGAIADLVHLQRQQQQLQQQSGDAADPTALYYAPIDVHNYSATEDRDPQEPSRIETRLHALHEQLRRIASSS